MRPGKLPEAGLWVGAVVLRGVGFEEDKAVRAHHRGGSCKFHSSCAAQGEDDKVVSASGWPYCAISPLLEELSAAEEWGRHKCVAK